MCRELLKEVGDEVEQNKPKHEWEERVKTRAMIVKERLARWDWVVGLLLLKPQYLNNREAKNDAMKWQDRQLKALRDVQEEVNHKDRMAVIKQEIAEIEREMMKSKINVKEAVESLRGPLLSSLPPSFTHSFHPPSFPLYHPSLPPYHANRHTFVSPLPLLSGFQLRARTTA